MRALPDGYTFLLASSTNAINATLYDNLNFNFIRDIAPVASIARTPLVMVVNPSFPAKSVPDFIAYAKANPGKINMATAGNGSSVHLAGELFKTMTGVQFVPVLYRYSYVPDMLAWTGAIGIQFDTHDDRAGQGGQIARSRGHHCDSFASAARRSDRRRLCTLLRGERMAWPRRTEEHACRDHLQTLLKRSISSRRSQDQARFADLGSVPSRCHLPTSLNSSPTKPRSGASHSRRQHQGGVRSRTIHIPMRASSCRAERDQSWRMESKFHAESVGFSPTRIVVSLVK